MSKELFEELYNDFYKLSLRNGRDNEEDILEGYLIDTIRKYPIETFGFKGVSDLWESNFLSHESYFLDKLMNLSTGRNLRIETNIRPHERIKSSGTKKEREIRAFADEIVKKIRVVWEDSLELNPQKKINIVITVSTADSIFG